MKKKRITVIFFCILLIASILRAWGLDRSFVLDEFRTIHIAGLDLSEMASAIKTDSYGPVSYLVLHAWLGVRGGESWIRLIFVIFGLLSVVMVYVIARNIASQRYALTAMFIASVMPMQIWVSQYVRGIGPGIFFLLTATYFFLKMKRHPSGGGPKFYDAAGYVLSSILAVYSFYFSFFVIAAQNIVYIVLSRKGIKDILIWIASQAAIAISFLPWLGILLEQLKRGNISANFSAISNAGLKVVGIPLGAYMRSFSGLLGLDQQFLTDIPMAGAVDKSIAILSAFLLFVSIITLSIAFIRRYKAYENTALAAFSVFSLTPFILSVIFNGVFATAIVPRYFAVSSIFTVFIYTHAAAAIKKRVISSAVIILFAVIGIARLADFSRPLIDYKSAAVFLRENIRDDECLLFTGGEWAYRYYSGLPKNSISTLDYMKRYEAGSGFKPADLVNPSLLKVKLAPFRTIWVYGSGERMSGLADYVMSQVNRFGYRISGEYKFKNISILKLKAF